jgi:hypothetical protein
LRCRRPVNAGGTKARWEELTLSGSSDVAHWREKIWKRRKAGFLTAKQ